MFLVNPWNIRNLRNFCFCVTKKKIWRYLQWMSQIPPNYSSMYSFFNFFQNLTAFYIRKLILIPIKVAMFFPVWQFHYFQYCSFWQIFCVFLIAIVILGLGLCCFTVTTVNFIDNAVFMFCNHPILRFTMKSFHKNFQYRNLSCMF